MHYKAFISYAHAVDLDLSRAIQQALQLLGKPWYRMRTFPVFRDDTDLSSNPHLWKAIENALDSSEFLILLCSPQAADSKWVKREIAHWLRTKDINSILLVITDGDVTWSETNIDFDWQQTTAVPDTLRGCYQGEPLWVDARPFRNSNQCKPGNESFAAATHRIAARLHGRTVQEMFHLIRNEHVRKIRFLWAGIIALTLSTVGLGLSFTYAKKQSFNALHQLSNSLVARGFTAIEQGKPDEAMLLFYAARAQEPDKRRRASVHDWRISAWSRDVAVPTSWLVAGFPVRKLFYSQNGERLIAVTKGNEKGYVTVWDIVTGVQKRASVPFNYPDGILPLMALTYHQQSGKLATGNGETVEIRDTLSEQSAPFIIQTSGRVRLLTFGHDAKYIFGVVTDLQEKQTCRVFRWRVADGATLAFETLEDDPGFENIDVSPDGQYLIASSMARDTIARWDAATGKRLKGLTNTEAHYFRTALFGPYGDKILSGGYSGSALLWDPKTAIPLLEQPLRHGLNNEHTDTVYLGKFSSDGSIVATVGEDLTLRMWNSQDGSPLSNPLGWHTFIHDIAFSPGTPPPYIVIGSAGKKARLVSLKNYTTVAPAFIHSDSVHAVEFNPDGKTFATGSEDGVIRLWKTPIIEDFNIIPLHQARISKLAISENQRFLASAANDGSIQLTDLERGQSNLLKTPPERTPSSATLHFLDSGSTLAAIVSEDEVLLHQWTVDGQVLGQPVSFERARAFGRSAATNSTGDTIAVGYSDGYAQVFSRSGIPRSAPLLHTQRAESDNGVYSVLLSKDGKYLVTAAGDGLIKIWDYTLSSDTPHLTMCHEKEDSIRHLEFNKSGELLLSVGNKSVKIWQWKTGTQVGQSLNHQGESIWRASFHPLSNTVVTAGHDHTARIWDVESKKQSAVLIREDSTIRVATFSPDGERLLTASEKGKVRLWDSLTGLPITPPYSFPGDLWVGLLRNEGETIIVGGDNGLILNIRFVPEQRKQEELGKLYTLATGAKVADGGGTIIPLDVPETQELAKSLLNHKK